MLKSKERVRKVAAYIASHYKEYVGPMGYKAFLVGVDREACAFTKKSLIDIFRLSIPKLSTVAIIMTHQNFLKIIFRG